MTVFKKASAVVLLVVVVGLVLLFMEGRKLKEVQSEIEISATPAEVWSVLISFENWQDWNPKVSASRGNMALGEKLHLTMIGKDGGDGPQYDPVVTAFQPESLIRWKAHMIAPFLFTNEKVIRLQSTSSGTLVLHKELFSGLLAPLFSGGFEKGVRPILEAMNSALKTQVESKETQN